MTEARSAAYTDVENEWRTTPTDLGGWANRASQMLLEAKHLRETLDVLWADFEWLCEQHPEHYGTYYLNRKEQVERALSND